jgi:hypothetical protein
MTDSFEKKIPIPVLILFAVTLAACGLEIGTSPAVLPTPTFAPSATVTQTPIPPVAIINGEEITVAEFEAELARFQYAQTGLGNTSTLEIDSQVVLDNMITTLLLEQGAAGYGFVVDEQMLQGRITALVDDLGGTDALTAWESAHGYSDEEFQSALRSQIAAAWMRDQISASVASTTEQVHVRQILLYNEEEAQQVLGLLQAGWNFNDLSAQYDPLTKGELGWFPKDYLPDGALEEAAFSLQPGQYSAIIHNEDGYHILYVVDRDLNHLLSPDALLTLQEHAVQNWLTQRRNESTIIISP